MFFFHLTIFVQESEEVPDLLLGENAVVVDVRTPDEYNANHFSGAISCPVPDMSTWAQSADR